MEELSQPGIKKTTFGGSHGFWGVDFYTNNIPSGKNPFAGHIGLNFGVASEKEFSKLYRLGFEFIPLNYNRTKFIQDSSKIYPNNILHKTERYSYNNFTFGLYNRFIFSELKNFPGFRIDIGASLDIPYSFRLVTIDVNNGLKTKVITTGLEQRPYGNAVCKIGYGAMMLKASYRLSDVFKNNTPYPNPPKFILGIVLEIKDDNYNRPKFNRTYQNNYYY